MLISEFSSREDVLSLALRELKEIGIKVRSEKHKRAENKRNRNKIFKVPLHTLELDNGILSNGSVCQIPKFVLLACRRIQSENKTEGLFRKTGNVKKQRQIQEHLESGGSLEKSHNVIDIANLLKTFFRELPEPLIPQGSIQDALIRSLIHCNSYEHKAEAILLTCLFLPPITVNTLAYFLQFLEVITKNSSENFMTVDNLVKVLTPSIMPMPLNAPEKRLQSHFKVMELLIENANLIGVVPDRMIKKEDFVVPPMTEERKKKKRRSGSLNRVFNGFRKMVGVLGGSSESLDKSQEGVLDNNHHQHDIPMMTPSKSVKKRRLEKLDIGAFSAKKKKENHAMTLTALQEMDDSPSSQPYGVENKKSILVRKSFGEKLDKPKSPPNTRRWSLAQEDTLTRRNKKMDQEKAVDYVRVPKSEYEAFKTRLNSIETKINEEFNAAKLDSVKMEMGANGLDKVESKFHETLKEIEKLDDPKTDFLAKRLSRELKIRPNLEHPTVARSPSARKIGSLRRRRDSATRLSRGNSWHISSNFDTVTKTLGGSENTSSISFHPKPNLRRLRMLDSGTTQSSTAQVTLSTIQQSVEKVKPEKPARKSVVNSLNSEIWTNATDFFNDDNKIDEAKAVEQPEVFKTPNRPTKLTVKAGEININKTPMLPPRLTTPMSSKRFHTPMSDRKTPSSNRTPMMTPSNDSGREARASIIQIRCQNAGQVAQKARLFDNLSTTDNLVKSAEQPIVKLPRVVINKNLENVKNMNSSSAHNVPSNRRQSNSPRRSSRSPGVNRRLQLRVAAQSPALKTIKENKGEHRSTKINLLKNSEVLNEIASPRTRAQDNHRKVLSQNNTPRRASSRTPTSAKKTPRRNTPTAAKSPHHFSRRAHEIIFD